MFINVNASFLAWTI